MNAVPVVTVGDTGGHAIDALERQRGAVAVVRRCPELAGLLAACQSGLAKVAVVAEGSEGLTATLVDRLTAVGVGVVAVAGTQEEAGRLRGIGASPVTGAVTAHTVVDAVLAAVRARSHPRSAAYSVPLAADGAAASSTAVPQGDDRSFTGHDAGSRGSAVPSGRAGGSGVGASAGGSGGSDSDGVADQDPTSQGGSGRRAFTGKELPAAKKGESAAGAPDLKWAKGFTVLRGLARPGRGPTRLNPLARRPRGHDRPPKPGHSASTVALAGTAAPEGPAGPGVSARPETIAVWGPIGSPGRTTLALNLAAELAAQGRRVLVVDADSYGASVAGSLGLLDESASIAQACRVADQGVLSPASLSKICTEVVFDGGTFLLLTGLTRADRWPELRAAAVERVLHTARDLVDAVVVDCGFCLETDEELSYDTVAPRRNAATLAVLARADTIYAVGSGDAIGIPRLIRALAELAEGPGGMSGATISVVLNKVRRKAVGGSPAKALEQAWERFGPQQPIGHFLPWDAETTDKALLEGRLLLEVSPDSPLRQAIQKISCAHVQQIRKAL
jgi:MinD-like ATPase involved in chromosome partitioning or flagellar assembly